MFIKNEIYRNDLDQAIEATPGFIQLYGKSFLITGATGLLASFIIDMFMYANIKYHADITVYALGRSKQRLDTRYASYKSQELYKNQKPYKNSSRITYVIQDVCDPLKLTQRVDYILHAAGDGYPAAFHSHPVDTMTPALFGTYHLLEYAKKYEAVRMLYISSGEVYGQNTENQKAFDESDSGYLDTLNPRACYPSAKRAAETLCASFRQQYGIDCVIARPGHVYGPNTFGGDNRASTQFINDILQGKNIVLKSDGNQIRSYTYVADNASGLLTVLLHGKTNEAYNIAHQDVRVKISEFATTAAEIGDQKCVFEHPDETELAQRTPIHFAVLNSEKLQKLGWKGKYCLKDGIGHTLKIRKAVQKDYENI